MVWTALDKPGTDKILKSVKSSGLGTLFSPNSTEARVRTLPFYRGTKLFRVSNYSTVPAFSLYYLGDEENLTYLNGDFDGISFYNTQDNLLLNEETILPYLDFYFIFVNVDVGEIKIIGPRDNYQILEEFPEGTDVLYDEARGVFSVYIPLYYDGVFMDATIEINRDGDVSIVDTRMSIRGIQDKIDYDSNSDY